MSVIPDSHRDLLERPLIGHLATLRDDGYPQTNPMWFAWDGEHLRFTTTDTRRKHRNVVARPQVAVSVVDPDSPYRYLEVRGLVVRIEPDPEGAFFLALAQRYGMPHESAPADAAHRVVLVVEPTATTRQ